MEKNKGHCLLVILETMPYFKDVTFLSYLAGPTAIILGVGT